MAKKRTWLEKKVSTPKNYGKKTTPKKVNVPKNNGKKTNSNKLKKDSKNDGKKTSKSDNKPKIAPQRIPKNEGKKKTTIEPQRIPKNYGKSEKKKTISIAPQSVPKREVEYQKKKQNERPTYFSSGAMRDGFSPVNYAKSIIGTGEDMLNDFFTGIGKIPESVIDNVANALAGAYSKSGQEDKYKQITDFVQRDLNKEFGFGDRISQFFVPLQTVSKTYDIANKILNGGNYENVSLLGEKSDSIVQSAGTLAGQIGLQESGINWMLTTASTSYNSALEEAYQNGATWEDSQRYAAISSVAEVLSERISGGIKLGGRTLDEGVKKVLTGKIKNNVARTFAKYGFDAVGEGAEEVVSQLGQNLGKKLSFEKDKDWEEIFLSEEARQEYIDSFIGGFVLPMVTNAGRLKTSATTGRDYDSNLSDNERRIAQKETEKRVNEEKRKKAISEEIERRTGEAKNILGDVTEEHKSKIEEDVRKEFDGGKDYTDTELSKRELNKIEDEVLEDLKLGEVDIDTIEEYFEPEKVRRINEINRLLSKENGIIGKTDNKEELLKERQKLRTEIAESMRGKLADDYVLQETYRQYALKDEEFSLGKNETYKYENGETITLDSKKDAITRELEKSFKESGIGNTNKAHTLFKVADRLQRKTGIKVKVLSDQQLKDAGLMDEGKLFNGKLVTKGDSKTLYLSTDATQSLNVVLGHEITHTLEGADGYDVFTKMLKEAAIKSGEYYKLKEKYSSLYDSKDLDSEMTAELAGNILFNDRGFINKMTDEPGIFKKIYDTVSSYAKATVGSKEGRQFEALKLTFEKMFSQSSNGGSVKGLAYSRSDSLESNDVNLLGNDSVIKNSVRTLPDDRQALVNNLVEAGFNKEQAAKWVDDVYGVASMILADRDRLDFEAHDNQTFVKNNQEYIKTVDASTLCAKRLLYQGTFDAISHRLPDMALTSNMILEIRQMMDEKGYEVPCGACYVESRRRHLGKFAQKWLDEYDGEYKPTLDQVTTTDGLEKLRKEHPQTHDDFIKGMNRLGSANPKVVQLRAEYKGEILKITKGQYEKINRIGGLRLQSFSDFETPHLLDMMQVVTDMATRGFVSQAYTKVPNFALVFGDTNVKINLSLMGKGKGVDENGNLIFDDKEGMDHNEAFRIRDMYSKNVGTIMVGINDEHILACMKDDRIDFIIPFHSSGWGQNELKIMKMDEWKDYEKLQREKWVATGKNCDEDIDPMSYWDYNKTGKENAEIYLQKCADEGRIPVFSNFLVDNGDGTYSLQPDGSTDGYWKMLIDFKMYDNDGVGSPHEAVVPNFNMEEARRVLNEYKGDANKLPVAEDVVDEFVKKYSNDVKEQFSLREENNKKSLNQIAVRDYAAELQSEYDTTFNPYNDIKELYGFMDSVDGKLSAEDMQEAESMASSIADDILLNMKASQTLTEEASDILKDLRGAKIALSDNQKSEVATAYDGYGRYIQSLFGSVRISKNGVPLDEQWQYWADAYPNLFDRGTPDSEQPMRLAEIIEQLRNSFEVADLPNKTDIELKILSDFYDYPGMRYDKSEAIFADAESSVQRKFKGEEVIDEPLRTGDVIDEEIALTESMLQDNIEKGNHILSKALERKLRDLRRERKRSIPSRKEIHKAYVDEIKNEFKANGMDFNKVLEDAKDKSTFSSVDNTPQRFIEKTLGYKAGQIFNKMTMSKLGKNEADGIRWLNSITGSNGLLSTLYDKYQIKPASKESAAAQKYAEGRYVNEYGDYVKYGNEELAREFKDTKTQERIRGLATDPLIREFYDNTFDRINESRTRNGYEAIPKRQNYYLHFIEDRSLYSRMGLPFNPNQIKEKDLPTDINGMTADNKPGQPYFASAQQRKGIRTTYDILGGIEKYANAAKDQIYHIDDIQRFRAVRNYLADMFGQEHGFDDLDMLEPKEQKERIEKILDEHLTNFAKFLNEEANIIAGKTPLIDRGLEGIVGRRALAFMKTLNSQVGSNMVGMNVGSSLTNMISVVQAVSKSSKADAIKSFTQMCLNTIVKTDDLMEQSDFWTRRQGSEKFYKNPWQKVQDLGYTLMTITDNFATEFIIRTKYNEFKRKGYDNPLQKADEWAARLLADRSLGQMPQLYNSKALGLITKFQLEVRNQLDSMWYDTINEAKETSNNTLVRTAKITSTVVQLAVLQHLFGKAFESVAGYNPAFDIVSVLITAFGVGDDDDDKEPMDRIEEAFLELLEDLPYTSTLKGGRIPMASALPVNEFITGQNKYGQDKSRLETIKEAAPYYALPTGYGQIKKTVKGMKMFDKDNPVPGQYNKSGKLQYPVDDNVMSRIQASIFGANANKNAREYYDGKHKPLTEKQLKEYQELNIPISDYWKYRKGLSEAGDKNDDKIKYINELNFPLEKKSVMMNNLYNKKEDAEKWYATKPAIYSVLGDNYAKAVRKLNTFKADKDEDGKTIIGSKKEKVIDYLNKSDFDYAEKLIIYESEGYKLTDDEHLEVIDYLNNREDVSYEQMEDILKVLGYEVDEEGNVRW